MLQEGNEISYNCYWDIDGKGKGYHRGLHTMRNRKFAQTATYDLSRTFYLTDGNETHACYVFEPPLFMDFGLMMQNSHTGDVGRRLSIMEAGMRDFITFASQMSKIPKNWLINLYVDQIQAAEGPTPTFLIRTHGTCS